MERKDFDFNNEVEKSIVYLVKKITRSVKKQKPVILHSLKVGLYLDSLMYPAEVVIAGVLHDVVEDSGTSILDIKKKFGKKVALIVKANSSNRGIENEQDQYLDMFKRCVKVGPAALVVKAADLLDNSYYYGLTTNFSDHQSLVNKLKYFTQIATPLIGRERVWEDINNRYIQLAAFTKIT